MVAGIIKTLSYKLYNYKQNTTMLLMLFSLLLITNWENLRIYLQL